MKLDFLDPLLHHPGPWASVYFDTSAITADAAAQRALQARDACERLAEQGADDATVRALHATLSGLDPDPEGHAVFATEGRVVLDTPLPVAPPATSLADWAVLPRLGPLLDYAARDPVCLVAFVDRRGADFELLGHGRRPRSIDEVRGQEWPLHRTGRADWSEWHFQLAVENTWDENAERIAEALAVDAERAGVEVLVLAGDVRERRAVLDRLPEWLRAVAVESDRGGRARGSDNRRLDTEVADARAERARLDAERALDSFEEGRSPAHGRIDAAEGVPALVDAAREHRIASLLVRSGGPDLRRDVWVGHDPDQVAVRRGDTRYLGDPAPHQARADDALLRSAAATGADVVALGDGTAVSATLPVGGLGALLRWPYEGAVPGGGSRTGPVSGG
ncbi:baeRF2 domain-containing protein [Streptomyces mayteni]